MTTLIMTLYDLQRKWIVTFFL